jgi:hypothetical protein
MSEMATIPPASPPISPQTEQKPVKTPRVPAKIVKLIDLLLSGACRSTKAACERIGIDPSYASRELRKVHVAAYLEQKTRVSLTMLQAPAAATLGRLMAEAASEHVQKDVAIHALAINGHKPKADAQVSVNIDIKAGYVIDLSPGPQPMIDVTPKVDGT